MEKRTRGCLLIGLGIGILLVVAGVALVVGAGYLFSRQFEVRTEQRPPEEAAREMDAVRARFGSRQPLAERDGDGPGVPEGAEPRPAGSTLAIESLHVMAFDARDRQFARVTIPFWLLRLAPDGKLSGSSGALSHVKGADRFTIAQIEAFGRGLLLDHREEDGSRVLLWTE